MTRYQCTHCGHRFEDEEKEIPECPSCFWSSSVKKEEDVSSSDLPNNSGAAQKQNQKQGTVHKGQSRIPFGTIFIFLAVIAVGVAVILAFPFAPPPEDFSDDRRDEAGTLREAAGALTPSETNLLNRKIQISSDRNPSEAENTILQKQVPFRTGLVEQLPSQAFTIENFKGLIEEQEKIYKVPLARGYKKKLEKVFAENYVPAIDAFNAGELLRARDLWVKALALPIYSDNVQKHRGVVLTMLRGYINDTLSKIGAINTTLLERLTRQKEQELSQSYQELLGQIQSKQWQPALGTILSMNQTMDAIERPAPGQAALPAYPPAIQQVDQGIAATLFDLLTPPSPTVANTTPIRADIEAKRKIIQTFLPDRLEKIQREYESALQDIRNQNWAAADKKLSLITTPPALAEDARQKRTLLAKLLDSQA